MSDRKITVCSNAICLKIKIQFTLNFTVLKILFKHDFLKTNLYRVQPDYKRKIHFHLKRYK